MFCDWLEAYRPAILALLAGQSPYMMTGARFANAPWTLLPLIPFALLPEQIGIWLLILASVLSFYFVAYRLGASPIALIAFVLSPFVVRCLWYGQIDWLPLLGVVMPPWLGLFFIATKPQVCGLVALYWLAEAWKTHTIVRTFMPVAIVTLLSFIPFGLWPLKAFELGAAYPYPALWPWSLLLSAALLLVSQIRKDKTLAAAGSPLAASYAQLHSFVSILLPLMRYQWLMVAAVAALWLAEVVR
jgi:hypothetical protein